MKKWEKFEIDCCKYLNDKYGPETHCEFQSKGGANSNAPDIVVYKDGKELFSIEVKMPLAQSGQFVLLPDFKCKQFVYSSRNKTKENKCSDEIVKVMNCDFEKFSMPKRGLIPIKLDEDLIYNWIQSHYQNDKGSKFFVTRGESGYVGGRRRFGYIIFPVNKLKEYFEVVSAGYRIKKSGSNPLNNSDRKNLGTKLGYGYTMYKDGKHTIVITKTEVNKNPIKCGSYDFFFKKIEPNKYKVTRLSNTRNANVIFSIKLKGGKTQDKDDLYCFECALGK